MKSSFHIYLKISVLFFPCLVIILIVPDLPSESYLADGEVISSILSIVFAGFEQLNCWDLLESTFHR